MTSEYEEIMNGTQVGGDHYSKMKIQPTEYIHANGLDFFEGNIVKYVSRHRSKNGSEDILKAIDYCKMILKFDYGIGIDTK